MKICILNESFLQESHINRLKKLGEVVSFSDTKTTAQAVERTSDASIVIADMFLFPINAEFFQGLKNLKLLALNTTAFDRVDLKSAKLHGVSVTNVPSYSTQALAEFCLLLLMAAMRKLPLALEANHKKHFEIDPGNSAHLEFKGSELKGKTLGILGLGRIGQRMAELGHAVGMNVIAWNRTPKHVPNVKMVSKEELFKSSDAISIHLSFNAETENIINAQTLKMMKPTAIIINTASNKHINGNDLYDAISNHQIAGAGIDVLPATTADKNLMSLKSVILTPCVSWFTQESLNNMAEIIVSNVESFVAGKAKNVVS